MVDTVVIKPEVSAPPAGHEEAMIAKVDAANAAVTPPAEDPPANPERPSWLPEKFKSVEDMAKAYSELEQKLGQKTPGEEPPKVTDPPKPTENQATPEDGQKAAEKAGLKLADLETEWRTNGKLSEDNMKKLADAGFSEADVQTYIAGRQALAAQYDQAVMAETPGGPDKYGEMVEWAKVNMSDAEIAAYNDAVASGDMARAKLAVQGLGARFASAVGNEPTLQSGRTNADAADVFESRAQVTEAMRNPLYKSDPAYRAKVAAKIARSSVF